MNGATHTGNSNHIYIYIHGENRRASTHTHIHSSKARDRWTPQYFYWYRRRHRLPALSIYVLCARWYKNAHFFYSNRSIRATCFSVPILVSARISSVSPTQSVRKWQREESKWIIAHFRERVRVTEIDFSWNVVICFVVFYFFFGWFFTTQHNTFKWCAQTHHFHNRLPLALLAYEHLSIVFYCVKIIVRQEKLDHFLE